MDCKTTFEKIDPDFAGLDKETSMNEPVTGVRVHFKRLQRQKNMEM